MPIDHCHGVAAEAAAMELALDLARAAAARGEVPVGAVVLGSDGAVLAAHGNRTEEHRDATAHAELLALRAASVRLAQTRLTGCTLVVTMEPCPMCAGAAELFRVRRLVFGAYNPKGGAVEHGARQLNRTQLPQLPEIIGGVREIDSTLLLRHFFKMLRSQASTSHL